MRTKTFVAIAKALLVSAYLSFPAMAGGSVDVSVNGKWTASTTLSSYDGTGKSKSKGSFQLSLLGDTGGPQAVLQAMTAGPLAPTDLALTGSRSGNSFFLVDEAQGVWIHAVVIAAKKGEASKLKGVGFVLGDDSQDRFDFSAKRAPMGRVDITKVAWATQAEVDLDGFVDGLGLVGQGNSGGLQTLTFLAGNGCFDVSGTWTATLDGVVGIGGTWSRSSAESKVLTLTPDSAALDALATHAEFFLDFLATIAAQQKVTSDLVVDSAAFKFKLTFQKKAGTVRGELTGSVSSSGVASGTGFEDVDAGIDIDYHSGASAVFVTTIDCGS